MPHWDPSPADIIVKRDHGKEDMGSLAYGTGSDTNLKARFGLEEGRFGLVFVRAHFNSGTSTKANMVINLDSGFGPPYDFKLKTIKNVGTGRDDANFRVPVDEDRHWIFDGMNKDKIVMTWTNPDSGNMEWGLEVGLILVKESR